MTSEPHFCSFLWNSMTILCDGNVTCGLDDPHGVRSFGNVSDASVYDIWHSAAMLALRTDLLSGELCRNCRLYTPVRKYGTIPADGESLAVGVGSPLPDPADPYPRHLIVEPTIACNLRCNQPVCNVNYSPGFTPRATAFMDFSVYEAVIREVGPYLDTLYFFNYGDPFLHPQAAQMLALAKLVRPEVVITTSTNGIPLMHMDRAIDVVRSGVDEIIFTIGGACQASYERYHVRGRLKNALQGMENVCRARALIGAERPRVTWRYLVFNWNDSDAEIDEAFALAGRIGVDRLKFHLTREPAGAASLLRAPGTPGHARIASNVDYAFGYHFIEPFEDGFYQWEANDVMGSFRWSSPSATMRVASRRARITLDLATMSAACRDGEPRITITGPFGERRVRPGIDEWRAVSLPVPVGYRDGREMVLRLSVEPGWRPADAAVNSDERLLGVMVRGTRVPLKSPKPGRLRAIREQLRPGSGGHLVSESVRQTKGSSSTRSSRNTGHGNERPS